MGSKFVYKGAACLPNSNNGFRGRAIKINSVSSVVKEKFDAIALRARERVILQSAGDDKLI